MRMCLPLVALSLLSLASAANILVMLPLPLYSHTMPYMDLFKTLASKGHNLTMVTPYPQKPPVRNMNDIESKFSIIQIIENFQKQSGTKDFSAADGWFFHLFGFHFFFGMMSELIMKDETVQRIINDETSSYDLIIMETFFGQEFLAVLGHKYNAPIVSISAVGMNPLIAQFTGNHFPAAYFPNSKFPFTNKMTFLERAKNSFFYIWDTTTSYYSYYPKQDALLQKYFIYPGSERRPSLDQLMRNISITLIDSHVSFSYHTPLHSNIIEVSGLSLKEKSSLPADLQKYMDDAKEGVIYFSLGSHYKSATLKPHIPAALLGAFAKVKQKVLMKWDDDIPEKSDNVKLGKWFPQASVLAHPNCRIFISHGGVNGMKEGIFHAVPIISMPLFADQKFNARFVESSGIGIKVDHETVTDKVLLDAVNKILSDPSYKENIKKRSAVMKDRPMSALDTAVYWVEYVIRHKGAPHLRPSVLDMPFCQYLLLDVIAFFALIIGVVFTVVYFILLLLFKCITCGFSKGKQSGKTKNKSKKE